MEVQALILKKMTCISCFIIVPEYSGLVSSYSWLFFWPGPSLLPLSSLLDLVPPSVYNVEHIV